MKLIVGLGNPGAQYAKTRHNAGFMVVDRVLERLGVTEPVKQRFQSATAEVSIGSERCLLMKPLTFMNRSGQAVGEAVRFFKVEPAQDLLVIVDDLYLTTGSVRMRPDGSAGGHNGLTSIDQHLAQSAYARLRVGVGVQPSGGKPPMMDQADFVLSRFSEEEQGLLEAAVAKAAEAVSIYALKGPAHAMNFANAGARPEKPKPEKSKPEGPKPDKPQPNSSG